MQQRGAPNCPVPTATLTCERYPVHLPVLQVPHPPGGGTDSAALPFYFLDAPAPALALDRPQQAAQISRSPCRAPLGWHQECKWLLVAPG